MWLGQSYHVPDHLSNSSNQRDSTLAQRRHTIQFRSSAPQLYLTHPRNQFGGGIQLPMPHSLNLQTLCLLIALYNAIWDVGRDVSTVCQDRTVPQGNKDIRNHCLYIYQSALTRELICKPLRYSDKFCFPHICILRIVPGYCRQLKIIRLMNAWTQRVVFLKDSITQNAL